MKIVSAIDMPYKINKCSIYTKKFKTITKNLKKKNNQSMMKNMKIIKGFKKTQINWNASINQIEMENISIIITYVRNVN